MDKWKVAKELMRCFSNSFIGYGGEFFADRESNTSFLFDVCETELDVKCKILEWFSRAAYKSEPYGSRKRNEEYHRKMRDGINKYLGTDFSEDDMDTIYTYLGNSVNRTLTREFVKNGYDMAILRGGK